MNTENKIKTKNEKYLSSFEHNQITLRYLTYLEKKQSQKTKTVVTSLFVKIQKRNENLKGIDDLFEINSLYEMQDILVKLRPSGKQELSQTISMLHSFVDWYNNEISSLSNLTKILHSINQNLIIKKTEFCRQKYFNNDMFKKICEEIELNEEYNSAQYITLFQSIYEGIYDKNLTPLFDLTTDNISVKQNKITFYDNNKKSVELNVSEELIENMLKLSKCNTWFTRNCKGTISKREIKGKRPNSIFKSEVRKARSAETEINSKLEVENSRLQHVLYRRLRKITEEYFGDGKIEPFQIYVSGILNRICNQLAEKGLPVELLFKENLPRNSVAYEIIENELLKSNYCNNDNLYESLNSLRYQIRGYEHIFVKNNEHKNTNYKRIYF